MPYCRNSMIRAICFALMLLIAPLSEALAQKKPEARQVPSTFRVKWKGQPGILRYRLQVARDVQFTDIIFDQAVTGREYVVELPPGRYYWRVATAVDETGAYSSPVPVDISTGTTREPPAAQNARVPLIASANSGWRTTTGAVAQPLAARLRTSSSFDLVGVNSDGMVYALDGANGVALWTARFRPGARRGEATGNSGALPFNPIIVNTRDSLANVIVAFEDGVRAIEGATGQELWRATLPGRAASGASVDVDGNGATKLFIIDDKSQALVVLNTETGKIISQSKLSATAIGAPVLFINKGARGLLIALEGGTLEMRSGSGELVRAVKFDATITMTPLIVEGPRNSFVMLGTTSGLLALDAELKPLWRVATESGDSLRGTLAAADLDGDGMPEVLMITRSGRVAAVSVSTTVGKIKWHASGATDAASATFADLDGDNVLDVLVAAGPSFALGLSGRDGSVIWKSEDEGKSSAADDAKTLARSLVTASVGSASAVLVGTDPARTGLRAIALPKGALKVVAR